MYTRFDLNEGDMLFLPPLWHHQVEACEDENISINWIFTKKETQVASKTLKRDFERYFLSVYFLNHPVPIVQKICQKMNDLLPGYLRVNWRYHELIQTPYSANFFNLSTRLIKELAGFAKVLIHINKIKPYLKSIKSVKPLKKVS